ncbi:MAG TPA: NAD(P)-dependent alcohol dehydrogenase [Bacteroidia bacterium]|nr:NAD(P)-dependent alcohol dehydrogenase [Bacteroidia bacterium]
MKALVYEKYGPPEVVQLKDIPKPQTGGKDILIKVYASTVNRTDSGFRSAEYFISRFWSGLLRPKHQVLGCEFAGEVEACGAQVIGFKPGDRVFGFNDKHFGGHAEYMCISEDDAVSLIPEGVPFEAAAAITEGAHYALVDIRAAGVKPGQSVMVYGATGAIGSAAVQLLKHFGAKVTAVSNSKNVDLVKSLGADEVIDYQSSDFTKSGNRYDFIFDAVGKSSFGQCKPLLKEKGIYISTELGKHAENIFYALMTPLTGGKKLLFPIPSITKEDVQFLSELVQKGEFKPVIDRMFTMEQIVEAYKYVESGQKTGNVILKVGS